MGIEVGTDEYRAEAGQPARGGGAIPAALRHALLESRQRWRDLVTLAADFVFETDAQGRFVFVSPDPVIGWPKSMLIGQPADLLLAEADDALVSNPFRPTAPMRRRRVWLRRRDDGPICLSFASTPLLDSQGRIIGARGIGQDVTEQDGVDAGVAAALHRGEVIDHILLCIRQEVLAPRMMQAALQAIVRSMGAEGCAVIDLLGDGLQPAVAHAAGVAVDDVLPAAFALLEQCPEAPAESTCRDGRPIVVCPSQTRFGEQNGVVLWRAPGGRRWDHNEIVLLGSATTIVRVILEHEIIQREMARQARTDPLTTLLNRRAFVEEVTRRIDRLDRDGLPGTLMFVDLDHFKTLNDQCGHDVGDDALCLTASLLRATVRPSDLVARLGGDEFALWMDGADHLTAAERAETLRVEGPRALGHLSEPDAVKVTMSIGIATRWPGRGEDITSLIARADQIMYEVKRAGRAHWRVAPIEGAA